MKLQQRILSLGYWLLQRILFQLRPYTTTSARPVGILYKPDAIGDFILASGLLKSLISIPDKCWILICSPQVYALAQHYFPGLEIHVLHGSNSKGAMDGLKKIISLRPFCKSLRVTELLCLKNGLTGMDHVLLNWFNPKISYGTPNSPILPACPTSYQRFSFTHPLPYPTVRTEFPLEVCAHHSLLACYNEKTCLKEAVAPYLDLPPHNVSEKLLLIFPVTRSHLRNYPLKKLAESVQQFSDRHPGYHILISGTVTEKPELENFQSLLSNSVKAEIFLPKSIIAAAKNIQCASIILSMDSAPAHLAICLGRPGVFILAGGQFNHFAPWGNPNRHIWLYHRTECYDCNWNCIFENPKCVWEIPPPVISDHLSKLAVKEEMIM
jgi:hypothetical protein